MKTQTERLTRLSEDLLLLTTTRARRREPEPVDVDRRHRARWSASSSPLRATRDVDARIAGPAGVEAMANGDLLYRCVFNLVDNAIKYSGRARA